MNWLASLEEWELSLLMVAIMINVTAFILIIEYFFPQCPQCGSRGKKRRYPDHKRNILAEEGAASFQECCLDCGHVTGRQRLRHEDGFPYGPSGSS